MIDYKHFSYEMVMSCDCCGDEDVFIGSFQECIDEAKGGGWVLDKKDDEWTHTCFRCHANRAKCDIFDEIP